MTLKTIETKIKKLKEKTKAKKGVVIVNEYKSKYYLKDKLLTDKEYNDLTKRCNVIVIQSLTKTNYSTEDFKL